MRRFLPPLLLLGAALLVAVVFLSPSSKVGASTYTGSGSSSSGSSSGSASASTLSEGQTLFDETSATCHGTNAAGGALAPNLRGVGAATVDLWISSGWMPLRNPTSQPIKKPAYFNRSQTIAIADYIGSLYGGLPIPTVNTTGASLSEGFSLFALNCAPCHTITGAGDTLSNGISAPPLHGLAAVEVAEAVRTGPGNMPRFSPTQLSKSQLTAVVAYVTKTIEHPQNPGGLGLGGVGPVAEGFIGLFVGVGACMLLALWIGDRTEHDEESAEHGHGHSHDLGAEHGANHG